MNDLLNSSHLTFVVELLSYGSQVESAQVVLSIDLERLGCKPGKVSLIGRDVKNIITETIHQLTFSDIDCLQTKARTTNDNEHDNEDAANYS